MIAIRVKMMEKVFIRMHRPEIREGVVGVLRGLEGRGSKTFFEGFTPRPLNFSLNRPPQTTMLGLHIFMSLFCTKVFCEKLKS